jgi:hypothetical protein
MNNPSARPNDAPILLNFQKNIPMKQYDIELAR